jgi:hypothetical protein
VIGLLSAELLRARSRRAIRMLLVGIMVGVVIAIGIGTWNSSRSSGEDAYQEQLALCLKGSFIPADRLPPRYDTLEEYCAHVVRPEYYESDELRWADLDEILKGTSSIVILAGAFIGATLGGADWTAGSMGTLLAWEPRRIRVLVVRASIAAAAAFAIALFANVFIAFVFRIGVAIAGTTDGTRPDMLGDATRVALTVAAVAGIFAVIAHAIATLGRSTVSAVGILFGYLVLVEGFLAALWHPLQPRLLVRAANVVVLREPLLSEDVSAVMGPNGGLIGQTQRVVLTESGAWLVLALWLLALLGLALLVFRSRDVN